MRDEPTAKGQAIPSPGPDGWLPVPELRNELAPGCWLGRSLEGHERKSFAPGVIEGATAEEAVRRGWARQAETSKEARHDVHLQDHG